MAARTRCIIAVVLFSAVFGAAFPAAAVTAAEGQAEPFKAEPTTVAMHIDGEAVELEIYIFGGGNYFKLRDFAYAFSGTEKQFAVAWDESEKAVLLTSGEAYEPSGGEMSIDGVSKTVRRTESRIFFDGEELLFEVYNIEGHNYLRFRSLASMIDVLASQVGPNFFIDTSESY